MDHSNGRYSASRNAGWPARTAVHTLFERFVWLNSPSMRSHNLTARFPSEGRLRTHHFTAFSLFPPPYSHLSKVSLPAQFTITASLPIRLPFPILFVTDPSTCSPRHLHSHLPPFPCPHPSMVHRYQLFVESHSAATPPALHNNCVFAWRFPLRLRSNRLNWHLWATSRHSHPRR